MVGVIDTMLINLDEYDHGVDKFTLYIWIFCYTYLHLNII